MAAIDHNHHLNLQQASNKDGTPRYTRRWSKRRKCWKLVVTKEAKTYSHIPKLMSRVLHQRETDKTRLSVAVEKPESHPERLAPNIGHYAAPPTAQLRDEYATRF